MNNKIVTQEDVDDVVSWHQQKRDKILLEDIPVVQNLDNKILNRIELRPESFDMGSWHSGKIAAVFPNQEPYFATESFEVDNAGASIEGAMKIANECGTTHCRAGWAIAIAGEAGWKLEQRVGAEMAGALIYLRNKGYSPNFSCSDEQALKDIKKHAAQEFSEEERKFARSGK